MPQSYSVNLSQDGYINIADQLRSLYEPFYGSNLTPAQKAAMTRVRKRQERAGLAELLATGVPGDLEMWLDTDGGLRVKTGSDVLFLVDKTYLTAHSKRSKHLLAELTALAAAEGLELRLVAEYEPFSQGLTKVAFWPFKTRKEIDDSAIVNQAVLRDLGDQPNEPEEGQYVGWDTATLRELL